MSRRRAFAAALSLVALATSALAVDREVKQMAKDADSFKRSDAARALGRDGSPEAAEILLDLLEDESPYVRDHTTEALRKLSDPEAIDVAAKAARHKDVLFRANLADGLGGTGSAAALDGLERLAGDRSPRVRAAVADAVWGYRELADETARERLDELLGELAADDEPAVRAAALEAVGRVRLASAGDRLRAALSDEDVGIRAVARMELRYVDADAALAGLSEAAADPAWPVRAQAVDDAFALKRPEGFDVLIGLLMDERERVAASAHRALQALAGKELGRDAEIWRAWWEANRETWEGPDRPGLADDGGGKTSAAYHGMPIDSGHIVFVLDASGSMREPEGEGTRWDLAVAELEKALDSLPDTARVNVIVFQEAVRACFDAPRELSKRKARKDLVAFAARVSPGQSGDLLGGMLLAFEQDNADTVFLLSDGAPSHGEIVDKDRVRAAIRARNRMTKMVVNAVGLGAKKRTERSFLQGVVRDAGGRVVFR